MYSGFTKVCHALWEGWTTSLGRARELDEEKGLAGTIPLEGLRVYRIDLLFDLWGSL